MIGALKLAAQNVQIRAVVANVDEQARSELTDYNAEAPRLRVQTFPSDMSYQDYPHQKLIVVDGLLAFKGSVNLTMNGWRKAAQALDMLEVVTNVDEVRSLHNKYFSPLWGQLSDIGDTILMEMDIPF